MATASTAYLAQIIANGLHNGMLYAVLAYGYVLASQVTHRADLAHGAVFAFAGQVLVMAAAAGFSMFWMTLAESLLFGAAAAAVLSAIVFGVKGRVFVPRLLGRNPNMMLAATLGLSIILMEAARIGADTRDLWLPPLLQAPLFIGFWQQAPRITQLQAINILAMLALLAGCEMVLARTRAGRNVRAVSDDPHAAALCGVDAGATTRNTVMAGGAIAAVGGVLAVLYFGNMSFGAGLTYGLKTLFIAAAGGFARPRHAALGAFLYGEAESLWDGYAPTDLRDMVFITLLAAVLCLRRGVAGTTVI